MNKEREMKIPFKKEYIETSAARLDTKLIGVFSKDSTAVINKKLNAIEKELKNAWIKGYKKGLIDKAI